MARRDVEPSLPAPVVKSVTHAPGTLRHKAAVSHSVVSASTDGGISASSVGLGRRTRSLAMWPASRPICPAAFSFICTDIQIVLTARKVLFRCMFGRELPLHAGV